MGESSQEHLLRVWGKQGRASNHQRRQKTCFVMHLQQRSQQIPGRALYLEWASDLTKVQAFVPQSQVVTGCRLPQESKSLCGQFLGMESTVSQQATPQAAGGMRGSSQQRDLGSTPCIHCRLSESWWNGRYWRQYFKKGGPCFVFLPWKGR